jgi:transcriptional regulator with XRE-family HTH domain
MEKTAQKIKTLRESLNITQEQLANFIWIWRVTLANLESWKRALKSKEMEKILEFFELTPEDFWEAYVEDAVSIKKDENYVLKNLVLYISERLSMKENFWETLLNKLLYFSDFDYYERHGNSITWKKYHKLPYWPVPDKIKNILEEMHNDWLISLSKTKFFWKTQTKILPLISHDKNFLENVEVEKDCLSPIEIINSVLDRFGSWTANAVSDWSHWDTPYKATKNIWDEISLWLSFYRTKAYATNPNNL